jgi:hypothetical protein
MCRPCEGRYKQRLRDERRRVKEHRAEQQRTQEVQAVEPPRESPPLTVEQAIREQAIDRVIDRAAMEAVDGSVVKEALEATVAERTNGRSRHPNQPADRATPNSEQQTRASTQMVYDSNVRLAADIPDDRKLEIGAAYEDMTLTTTQVCARFGINAGVLMVIVRELGITLRSQRPEFRRGYTAATLAARSAQERKEQAERRQAEMQAAGAVPAASYTPLDAMLGAAIVEATPTKWRVAVEGNLSLDGTLEQVIAEVRRLHPGLMIVAVAQVRQ